MQDLVRTSSLWNAAVDETAKADAIRRGNFRIVSRAEANKLIESGVAVL